MIIDCEDQKIEYIQNVFKLVNKRGIRTQNAINRRQALRMSMQAQEEPRGMIAVRLEFIKGTATKIVKLLGESGLIFNTMYGDDLATIADLLDILAIAGETIKAS